MKHLAILFLLITIILPIYGKSVVIEVSKAYPTTVKGRNIIKMHSLKDAFDYCNKYKGSQMIEIVLKDEVNTIDATLLLRGTKAPITIKAKKGISNITSGDIVDKGFVQRGDTLVFPYTTQCRKLLVNGHDVSISNTFSIAEKMNQLKDVRKIDDYHYTSKFSREEIKKLEVGCDVFAYTRWQCYKLQVTEIDVNSNIVSLSTMGKIAFYLTDVGVRYTIYNSKKLMQPGTFCWEDGKVYYLRNDSEEVSNISFTIPTVATLVKVYECNNITFQNISFENAVLEDWYYQEVQGSALCSRAVLVEYSSNINFINCDYHNNMGYSLAIGNHSSNCNITGCGFTNLQGGGIILGMEGGDGTHNICIDDNCFIGFGRINVCCEAILSQNAHHVNITRNTISDGYYSGINLGWTWGFDKSYSYGNYVANNYIHHLMQGVLDDGGGIYTLGVQNGTIIENNYIHDIYPDKEMACLIYMDEGSSGMIVKNNICFASKRGINESYGRNNIIQNNVIGYVDKWGIRLSYPEKDSNLRVVGNKIIVVKGVSIDSNIPVLSLKDNMIISRKDDLYDRYTFMAVSTLYKKNIIEGKMGYGCKSRRLKKIAG